VRIERVAFIDQREEHDRATRFQRSVGGVFVDELPARSWMGFSQAWFANGWIQLVTQLRDRSPDPRGTRRCSQRPWYDIHASI
jgi:hypothetical protein